MENKKSEKDQVIAGSTKLAASNDKKRRLKIYGTVVAALVLGTIGAYTLLFSKAAPGDLNVLKAGQSLATNQGLVATQDKSPYRAVMQGDGNLVVYNNGRAIWQSGTAGTGSNNRLALQTDGNLVVYTGNGQAVWNTGTAQGRGQDKEQLLMQPDGNLVLYGDSGAIWSSFTGLIGTPTLPTPNNVTQLTTGQTLATNQILFSSVSDKDKSAGYKLVMQGDGNLVVYNPGGRAIWQSGTPGTGSNNRLVLQGDGNLVVYTAANRAVWNTATVRDPHNIKNDVLLMQPDGNLVLYSEKGPVWSSFTGIIPSALK